jgi:hypothetical protein
MSSCSCSCRAPAARTPLCVHRENRPRGHPGPPCPSTHTQVVGAGGAADPVVWAGCGDRSSLLLLRSGRLLACGCNRLGQLGLGPAVAMASRPTPVPGLPAIRLVAAGTWHAVAVEAQAGGTAGAADRLWGWGRNDRGQVGPAGRLGLRRGEAVVAEARRVGDVAGGVVSVRNPHAVDTDVLTWARLTLSRL